MSSTLTLTRSTPNAVTLGRVFAIGAMVLIVLGTKLIFVQAFGSAVPYWISGMLKQTVFTGII